MYEKIIVDADLCLKLGNSEKYEFLYELLPIISKNIYIHTHVYGEVRFPKSAKDQLDKLINEGKAKMVNENELSTIERVVYDNTYNNLARVMLNPNNPNKNKGETCSLAYAKAKSIPIFATDEKELQGIIDSQLNTGIDDITCVRLIDIIKMAKGGSIDIPRKKCKAIWRIAGNTNDYFDVILWPIEENA